MNFVLRPFAGYLLLIALAALFGMRIAEGELKPAMRRAVEELLVDSANLMAEIAAAPAAATSATPRSASASASPSPPASASAAAPADGAGLLTAAYARFEARRFDARIYDVEKTRPDLRFYLTDAQGRVRFDSERVNIGADFSRWNDVRRTLDGEYGARASRTDPSNPATSVLYVAAPVFRDGKIDGVLTLGKSSLSFEPFVEQARASILRAGGVLAAAAILIALALSWWISRDLRRLSQYARDASAGRRVPAPRFRGGELATLSTALSGMREELEGKAHVERLAQLLTHELKSPLAAIAGAAELLDEDMAPDDRRRFVGNIRAQTAHMQALVERLAQLTVLENRRTLTEPGPVPVRTLVDATVASRADALQARGLHVSLSIAADATLTGERVLLQLALANLLDNAIAFSPAGGTITVTHTHTRVAGGSAGSGTSGATDELRVRDQGSGIPDYAQSRLFERFYSLPRPDTGVKSTGLGLLLVREVAALHGGSIDVASHRDGGTEARLRVQAGNR